jgi:hypothetical protein
LPTEKSVRRQIPQHPTHSKEKIFMPTFTTDTRPGSEHAIVGVADQGIGVFGRSEKSTGTGGKSNSGIGVHGISNAGPGVRGDADNGVGVFGGSKTSSGVGGMTESGIGVHGISRSGVGVRGDSDTFQGVFGHSNANAGVVGESRDLHGVFGICENPNGAGVFGTNDLGFGVEGFSKAGRGVWGHSDTGEGIRGETQSPTVAAIAAFNLNPSATGAAIYAQKDGSRGHAGFFKGNVHVAGNLTTDGDISLQNADCAEEFEVFGADSVEPGTVMVLGYEGVISASQQAYDKRVAGVVAGAGGYKPGIVLDRQQTSGNRQPIALLGKVFCKVDAQFGAIEVGDLLTTSPTPGHAMKTSDPFQAFGAVIGKALRPLTGGQGLIPILIALQ